MIKIVNLLFRGDGIKVARLKLKRKDNPYIIIM